MSKIKDRIRTRVSQELDVLIPENRWLQYIDALDSEGKFTRRVMLTLIMILCQQVETLENAVEDVYFELETKGRVPEPQAEPKFKLRTPIEIMAEMDKDKEAKSYHLSQEDWKLMSLGKDQSLAHSNPEEGLGKENNPLTGKEEVCLYYQSKPVFRK